MQACLRLASRTPSDHPLLYGAPLWEEALIPTLFITLPSSGVEFPAPAKMEFWYFVNLSV